MNRRTILKSFILAPLLYSNAYSSTTKESKPKFKISMYGDLDDDLIILKSTPEKTVISDIHQMHNSKGTFFYNGEIYPIEHNPGYIQFTKNYEFNEDEIYLVCLANEMEDAEMPLKQRIRTHFKNEKLFFNKDIFLRHLMPEYNSVPNYPLWFNEGDVAYLDRQDINGNLYNYYNLFENTVVQNGLVFPKEGKVTIMLFNNNSELVYTFNDTVEKTPKYIKSDELKSGKLNEHPFTEIGNILNQSTEKPTNNDSFIANMIVVYNNKHFNIKFPYPAMYPNLLSVVAAS